MADARGNPFGFARPLDVPIRYIERTRDYYAALGYPPYEWAHYSDVPFQPLRKPLSECRVALITTAAPFMPDKGDQGPGAPYNAGAKGPSSSRFIPAMLGPIPICASPILRSTASIRRRKTRAVIFRWQNCGEVLKPAGSARLRRGFMGSRPIAANARR
jgi:hypothetical protein